MAAENFWLAACILATWVVAAVNAAQHPTQSPTPTAPTPSGECGGVIFNMVDCVAFLSVGSNDSEPEPPCCFGFKMVLNAGADCVCEALRSNIELGVSIDMSKVVILPSSCGISAPSISNCDANPPPTTAPAPVPPVAPPINGGGGLVNQTPAPSPHHSGAYAMALSSAVQFSIMLVSLFQLLA